MVRRAGRRQSTNVEDGRGAAAVAGGGMIIMLLRLIVGRFGIRGILFLVVGFFALSAAGINPMNLISGQQGQITQPTAQTGSDDEELQFVRIVLAETEDTWAKIFAQNGSQYPAPTLRLYSSQVNSACGFASSAAGPFYCPADQKIYLDTSFFRELSQRFGAPGDFAAYYVIAHEVGHHVQTVTGTSAKVREAQARSNKREQNLLQVRMELQADCYAGIWAHDAKRAAILEPGDIDEGLRAAEAIGDDALQRNAGRPVTPHTFTHGSSEQRQRWFTRGFQGGDVNQCDTFATDNL